MTSLVTRSEHLCHGGQQGFYEKPSGVIGGPMRFSVFLPPAALAGQKVPAVYYLAGLECNETLLPTKAHAQGIAASLGLALVACDTSPRHARYPGDDASWDFGSSASFYLDATAEPYAATYQMESHVAIELPTWIEQHFPVRADRRGIFGHSMGGHGALTLGLRHAERYASVSAFAPIVAPSQVPWGHKAFTGFLGDDRAAWAAHDACELVRKTPRKGTILVDQGLADKFVERELRPELFEAASAASGQSLTLRRHDGYDHSYYFVATFMADHLRHHARHLLA